MPARSRLLTLVAALLLGVMFVAPVWRIKLLAPQYPEGLGMVIRLNTVEGAKEHDLRNINALNHYIGMKPIDAAAIPELKYMPWIAGALIALGLVAAGTGQRPVLTAWLVALVVAGLAGLYDFWRWGYDYGHNLDIANAIIVVPDMTYQPPLIGTKQLLNFTATSLPGPGAIAAGIAFLLGAVARVMASARVERRKTQAAAAALMLATACAPVHHVLHLGEDVCAECRMVVSDPRFGAKVVTQTGRALAFDSFDCAESYLAAHPDVSPRAVWVADAHNPGSLIRRAEARVIQDATLRPPMGTEITVGVR